MSKSRRQRRSDRLEQRREERAAWKSQPTSSRRNLWLALGGTLALGVVLVGALAIGFAQDGSTPPTTAADGSESGTATSASTSGNFPVIAYPQGIPALGPKELEFTELLGTGEPVVLNFWAGQCPPCRAEMPAFQSVYDTYSDDFLLVGVDIGPFIGLGTRQSAIDLLAELDITYPTAYAVDARAMREFNVLGMPTTVFYDGYGVETGRHTGLLTEQALEDNVRDLIGA